MREPTESEQTALDLTYADAVRRQIEHEDVLIVNRLSWLIASQSFLFTAYAITLNGVAQGSTPDITLQQHLVTRLVSLLALISCVLIYLGILGGIRVMANLRRSLAQHHAAANSALRPPIQGSPLTLFLGHAAPLSLPLVFAAAWIVLLRAG